MNILETHGRIIQDYAEYIRSFIYIADDEISRKVQEELGRGKLWPEPLLQFNPSYEIAGTVEDVTQSCSLHPDLPLIFSGYSLYRHQLEAIRLGTSGKGFVVTSGTGSGKSLTYIASIFNRLLQNPGTPGVLAVVVYPMNALINSQTNEFNFYKSNYEQRTGRAFPITFGQYTGQEKESEREKMREQPPQVLLTNYMMLELLLTRIRERPIRDAIYANLGFLVFDELHTYRGRQGADVAMLIRRIKARASQEVVCIGTSATMASAGSSQSQKIVVAEFAEKIFGKPFSPDQVVDETLTRSLLYDGKIPVTADLAQTIQKGIDPDGDENELRRHPVAVWLENRVALEESEGAIIRRRPMRLGEVVALLVQDSGLDEESCRRCLDNMLLWISSVNKSISEKGSRYTILPFKLHQFIAQTGSVYTTLDQNENRFITLEPGPHKKDEENKPIYPNVFSRASGKPFICVSLVGNRLKPREFKERTEDEETQGNDGYLIVGEDVWDPMDDMDFLPDSWFRNTRQGRVPASESKKRFPRKLFFDESGFFSESFDSSKPFQGWFMTFPLLFDPTAGVLFDGKLSEGAKLTRLGSEGRSTSTTISAFAILNRLHDAGFSLRDQKLLSFTDNRQDAALQAGHFNDFVRIVHFRSAVHKAMEQAPDHVLHYANIGDAVFAALKMDFCEYANLNEEPPLESVRQKYVQAFKNFLFYLAVQDLRRSWRIVLPNLEQCGLMAVDYESLDEVAAQDDFWADLEIVANLSNGQRRDFLMVILDFFRQEYALHSENFFQQNQLDQNRKQFRERLKPPWTCEKDEDIREPHFLRLDAFTTRRKIPTRSMGPASSLGKYIKYFARQVAGIADPLRNDQYREFMLSLLKKLTAAGYLISQDIQGADNQAFPLYRLRIDKILWKPGDGESVRPDVVKRRSYKDLKPRPNTFFRELYRRDFSRSKRLRAEDHTGQLRTDDRRQREERFRAEWFLDDAKTIPDNEKIRSSAISALFCSPTMELGIDIGGLTVVHMRNAPPNPANYAQRSGRAGRNGQGALIFTYCSSFSPHDSHYFQHQDELVHGQVLTPRLDLLNQEMLLTHLNALAISETGLPGLDYQSGQRPSVMNMVRQDDPAMPLSHEVILGLKLNQKTQTFVKSTFHRVIEDFEDRLKSQASDWFNDDWLDINLSRLPQNLDEALKRWRHLYRSARALLERAGHGLNSGRLLVTSDEYRKFKRLQDQATRQINLLCNEQESSAELSEFYPFRYLAAEGFLPGYNFTRLPVRVYIPTETTAGEYISRPRPIALREFGPHNIIYHNGRKFRIHQLVVQDAETMLQEAKVSIKAGYYLEGEQRDLEICPFSGANLADNANCRYLCDLLDIAESRAEETERISCAEEERLTRGYNIQTYFSVDAGNMDRIRMARASYLGNDLLRLRYIPAARLVYVNSGWRTRASEGFSLGLTSGDWHNEIPENSREQFRLVKLKTSTTADALYLEPIPALGLKRPGVITLQYALKRAVEQVFLVEPDEIGVCAIGDPELPNILLYEAAEGSLGILSQIVDKPDVFIKIIQTAITVCRFDDPEYKAPASYNDLLSYYNQRDHDIIDRRLIKGALNKLALCQMEIVTNPGYDNYEEQYRALLKKIDPNSSTERQFLDFLHENNLRLPDDAQKSVEGIYCKPDFHYEPRFWIFCDGTPHDSPGAIINDDALRQQIIARGDEVWVWHYRENLAARIAQRPDIFRKVR